MADPPPQPQTAPHQFPPRSILIPVSAALMVSVLLIALDINILAVAVPKITTQFHSLPDVAWYSAGYLLTQMSLQPTYGKIYAAFPLKSVYTFSMIVFMCGNVVCATAKGSVVLIVGRAVQGCGSAGLFSGALSMGMYMVPKHKIPIYMALVVSMFAVAAVVGPLLGGVFTGSKLTWRWCFWINLPIGALATLLINLLFPEPSRPATNLKLKEKLSKLDYVGSILLVSSLTSLLLGFQWGGVVHPWSDSRVWGCLLSAVLVMGAFILVQKHRGEDALIPLRLLRHRSITAGSLFISTLFMSMNAHVIYLPFYLQSVKSLTPSKSGVLLLPYVVSNTISTFVSAGIITATGVYVPFMWASAALMLVGCGLLYTLQLDSTTAQIIGYQLVASFGFGLGIQVPVAAIPSILPENDVPTGNAIALLAQGLGGSLSASIAQTIFTNSLYSELRKIPSVNAATIVGYGATNVQALVPAAVLVDVQNAYANAVRKTFILPVAACALGFLSSLGMKWGRLVKEESTRESSNPEIAESDDADLGEKDNQLDNVKH